MTGAQLKKKLISIYGREFHTPVAAECEVDKSTVYRWCASNTVPGLVAAWVSEKLNGQALHKSEIEKDK